MIVNMHPLKSRLTHRTRLSILSRAAASLCLLALLVTPAAAGAAAHFGAAAAFTKLDLYANIETAGVLVTGSALPARAELFYRRTGAADWLPAHPLLRIDEGRLAGSLFGLLPGASYDVRVVDGAAEISGVIVTQTEELPFTPAKVLYVNDDAPPGGDGTVARPFRLIQEAVNLALPGTQVLVSDGVYRESISFPASGADGNWIQVKAEGNNAILEGSETITGNVWTPVEGKKNLWSMRLGRTIGYLARDQKRFYNYDDRTGLMQALGHDKAEMTEGWWFEPGTLKLYVRSLDDPSTHTWQAPVHNHAFDVDGRSWIWIEGFEMRLYGTRVDGCGVCAKNASHLVIRRNRIRNLQLGIFVDWNGTDTQGNDTRIEFNEISDPAYREWSWSSIKGSSMEGTAIVLRGHIGAILRGNDIHHFFNGIYTGSSAALENSGVAFDADIYDNRIHDIRDDALEPEGACINQRFRDNTLDNVLVGVSLAPVTQGPVWVLRTQITNFTGRSLKLDRASDGIVLVYHNTSWTSARDAHALDVIMPVRNTVLRNNIFHNNGLSFEAVPTGSVLNDWNSDNWYTSAAAPRFVWENKPYDTLAALCAGTGLECNGYDHAPGLANPAGGDFKLLPSSPNIDRATPLPGINDQYAGSGPDLGAFEYAFDPFPTVLSSERIDADPTNAASVTFRVTFSEPVTGVDEAPPFGDFGLTASPGITGASIASVSALSESIYSVTVNTGSGNGTLRLDVRDDDSIADLAGGRLGGPAAGNGDFLAGQAFTIDKNLHAVLAITRADANPSGDSVVRFGVTFSKPVTGVDASDFTALASSGITGAGVTEVSGSGSAYTVAVNTGSGDGTLRLDLVDDDSILDATLAPLGGSGAGNGNFITGESYTVNKNPPLVVSSLPADPDPTAADSVRFTVTFSESVSGVDVTDFSLTASGVQEAGVSAVSGADTLYTVTAGTGSGNGTLRLDLLDDDSILDSGNLPLGGAGAGNGNFTAGGAYTIDKPVITIQTATFVSGGSNDGWVLESGEDSNRGGSTNAKSATLPLGDDVKDRQYRGILHFSTDTLPDNAVVTSAILTVRGQGLTGGDPFNTLGGIAVDIRAGGFGAPSLFSSLALQPKDFNAASSRDAVGLIQNNPVGGWYWALLDGGALPFVNLKGPTQVRLRFQSGDNDNRRADTLSIFTGNYNVAADRPQLRVEYYVPLAGPPPPVTLPTALAAGPTPAWTMGSQGVGWAEVSFEALAPRGVTLKESWNALGSDDQNRVYIGFTSARSGGREDFLVFRYNPATGERAYLGSFQDVLTASQNSQAGEQVPKGHTRLVFADGRLYMGSQGFHDLKGEIDSLTSYRGSHLFAYHPASGQWEDLSAGQPGGVLTRHEGLLSLNILPERRLLVGLAHPSSDIILYNYQTEKLVGVYPGIPWKLGNPLSREIVVAPSGRIYTYRGTEAVDQRQEVHSVWVFNPDNGEMKDTGFQMTNGFWVGQTRRRDGSKTYINTIAGQLYEFDAATETFRDLGYELPPGDNRIINYTYAVTLSPDESRLYYVLSVIQKPDGSVGTGSGGSGELYYYDLAAGRVVFVQQLPPGIYTSADVRDSHNIYFAHFGNSSNLWSGNPRLFILHVSS